MYVATQAPRLISAVRELGIDPGEAVERGAIDAVIYLLEQAGAEFGYRYEWERFGPFSTGLAADIAELAEGDLHESVPLSEGTADAVERLRPVVDAPADIKQFTWIRLLASLDFLDRFAVQALTGRTRPAYIEATFEEPMIEAAQERLQALAP